MDVPMGKYFELVVTFDPSKYIFQATWNGDNLEPYPVPSQEFTFQDSMAEGDMSLYYLGYSFIGMWSQTVNKLHTTLTFGTQNI